MPPAKRKSAASQPQRAYTSRDLTSRLMTFSDRDRGLYCALHAGSIDLLLAACGSRTVLAERLARVSKEGRSFAADLAAALEAEFFVRRYAMDISGWDHELVDLRAAELADLAGSERNPMTAMLGALSHALFHMLSFDNPSASSDSLEDILARHPDVDRLHAVQEGNAVFLSGPDLQSVTPEHYGSSRLIVPTAPARARQIEFELLLSSRLPPDILGFVAWLHNTLFDAVIHIGCSNTDLIYSRIRNAPTCNDRAVAVVRQLKESCRIFRMLESHAERFDPKTVKSRQLDELKKLAKPFFDIDEVGKSVSYAGTALRLLLVALAAQTGLDPERISNAREDLLKHCDRCTPERVNAHLFAARQAFDLLDIDFGSLDDVQQSLLRADTIPCNNWDSLYGTGRICPEMTCSDPAVFEFALIIKGLGGLVWAFISRGFGYTVQVKENLSDLRMFEIAVQIEEALELANDIWLQADDYVAGILHAQNSLLELGEEAPAHIAKATTRILRSLQSGRSDLANSLVAIDFIIRHLTDDKDGPALLKELSAGLPEDMYSILTASLAAAVDVARHELEDEKAGSRPA